MKVLHIITSLNTGGAEMMLHKLVSGMDENKFQPVVISMMSEGSLYSRFIDAGIEVHCLGLGRGKLSFQAVFNFYTLIKVVKPNIIQGWMYHGNLFALLAKFIMRNHVSCFWNIRHCVYSLKKEKKVTALLIKLGAYLSFLSSGIIYNSELSREQHEKMGYCKKKSVVIANGFDLAVFKRDDSACLRIRSELQLNKNALLVGMIGRFHPMKDHHNFLRSAGIVAEKNPNVYFLLAGREVAYESEDLAHWVEVYGLKNRVFLLGERHDTPALNAAMDVAVLSSNSEAFPNVVGEAMASSTPCAVTAVGDAALIVGITGRVVSPSNANMLAEAVIDLISLPEEARLRLGEAARMRIEKLFSLEKIVKKYEALYRI